MTIKKLLLLSFILFLIVNPVYAISNSPGSWDAVTFFVEKNRFVYYLKTETRFNFDNSRNDQLVVRPAAGYIINSKIGLWLGYDYIHRYNGSAREEQRMWQQMEYHVIDSDALDFISRTRFEQRYSDINSETAFRLRERFFVKFRKVSNHFSPVIYDEFFFNLNNPGWVSSEAFSQNRAFLGVDIHAAKKVVLFLGYLNRVSFRSDDARMEHILYASLNFNFTRPGDEDEAVIEG